MQIFAFILIFGEGVWTNFQVNSHFYTMICEFLRCFICAMPNIEYPLSLNFILNASLGTKLVIVEGIWALCLGIVLQNYMICVHIQYNELRCKRSCPMI